MEAFLLEYAKGDYKTALYKLNDPDDISLRIAANHVEQAIEKTLKQILKDSGLPYEHTHNISALLASIPEDTSLVDISLLDEIEPYAGMLVGWVTKIKYDASVVATRRVIQKLAGIAGNLIIDVSDRKQMVNKNVSEKKSVSWAKTLDLNSL